MTGPQNNLISLLPGKERKRLIDLCEPVALAIGNVIYVPGGATRHVYFPTEGFVSLVASTDGAPRVELGMAGYEGMLGAHLALNVKAAPLHALVQGEGIALRLTAPVFVRELGRSPRLLAILHRYLYVMMAQFAASAACMHSHAIAPRLARWLLMTQDRARADSFHVTHEFLSYMLGVRRAGITLAAVDLQRKGFIEYKRGTLNVLDRPGLLGASCACYGVDNTIYQQSLGVRV